MNFTTTPQPQLNKVVTNKNKFISKKIKNLISKLKKKIFLEKKIKNVFVLTLLYLSVYSILKFKTRFFFKRI